MQGWNNINCLTSLKQQSKQQQRQNSPFHQPQRGFPQNVYPMYCQPQLQQLQQQQLQQHNHYNHYNNHNNNKECS